MNAKNGLAALLTVGGMLITASSFAQTIVSEDFTGATTNASWYFFNGACLTARSTAASSSPGTPPGCTAIGSTYYNENLDGGTNGVAGGAQTLPDAVGSGALRFTNGYLGTSGKGGYGQNGAIVSAIPYSTASGLSVSFKTVTYRGDSGGGGSDGADGMSFFLLNGTATPNIGSWGGSLGYTCSSTNTDFHGIVGAYLGLGIDEYGNFLNGSSNTLGETGSTATNNQTSGPFNGQNIGDNTASGGLYMPNRIGMRGGGNIAWSWLHSNYPAYYPGTLTAAQQSQAVQYTCISGYLWNFSSPSSPVAARSSGSTIPVMDYPALPNAYKVISTKIANEYSTGGYARGNATAILYNLKITSDGLLSLSYTLNSGATTQVLKGQSISASNGLLPSTVYFGFGGSTGGSNNIHEILCFKATPADQSASSAAANVKQSAQVQTGSQAYLAFYDPSDWTGRLTANSLLVDSSGNLTVATAANWDASCVLTGVAAGSTCLTTGVAGPTNAQGPSNRSILTWNGTQGVAFQFSNLTAAQKTALNLGDASSNANRLNYLRGDRSNEVNSSGVGLFRIRDSVLADIVDSSPTWVGPPSSAYQFNWRDRLFPAATMPENSGSQNYTQFQTTAGSRLNVVYVGANDGLLHGFRTGSFSNGTFVSSGATPNDGQEVLAYMPGSILQSAASSTTAGACASSVATQSVVQSIHGETPAIGSTAACTQPDLDYSSTQYGHNYFVNATPGTGDLFYNGGWHTWVAGGLGAGGAAIYALDVTNPVNFSESNASSTLLGEWNSASITCANSATCGNSLGSTYGTPLIRRLHNGQWAVIFGNGFGSTSGDAGIFIMLVPTGGITSSAPATFYYLSTQTGSSSNPNGIAYVTSADLDGDHVTDYVYAGDLLGNVWRFDLTSATPTAWVSSSAPLFTTLSGQPITSQIVVAAFFGPQGNPQIMLAFGTGQKTGLTNVAATSYASGAQAIYAFWDWNFSSWNNKSAAQYATLVVPGTPSGNSSNTTGLSAPFTVVPGNLTAQTLVVGTGGTRDIPTTNPVCWQGASLCSSNNNSFGWRVTLPGTAEQIVFNPELAANAFVVNSVVPANNSPLACTVNTDTGFTYALAIQNGAAVPNFFTQYHDINSSGQSDTAGIQTNAVGTSTIVTTNTGGGSSSGSGSGSSSGGPPGSCQVGKSLWLVAQTSQGTPTATQASVNCNFTGSRVTWTEMR